MSTKTYPVPQREVAKPLASPTGVFYLPAKVWGISVGLVERWESIDENVIVSEVSKPGIDQLLYDETIRIVNSGAFTCNRAHRLRLLLYYIPEVTDLVALSVRYIIRFAYVPTDLIAFCIRKFPQLIDKDLILACLEDKDCVSSQILPMYTHLIKDAIDSEVYVAGITHPDAKVKAAWIRFCSLYSPTTNMVSEASEIEDSFGTSLLLLKEATFAACDKSYSEVFNFDTSVDIGTLRGLLARVPVDPVRERAFVPATKDVLSVVVSSVSRPPKEVFLLMEALLSRTDIFLTEDLVSNILWSRESALTGLSPAMSLALSFIVVSNTALLSGFVRPYLEKLSDFGVGNILLDGRPESFCWFADSEIRISSRSGRQVVGKEEVSLVPVC